jgi:hypothetical protein
MIGIFPLTVGSSNSHFIVCQKKREVNMRQMYR